VRWGRSLLAAAMVLAWAMIWAHPASPTVQVAEGAPAIRLLLVTATAGFRHGTVETARSVVPALGAASGEFVTTIVAEVADLGQLNAETLRQHDVVMFANTSGNLPLDDGQKAALLQFMASGGGFVGTHSATDTLYDWPEYGQLIDAYFKEHPWTREAAVNVEDGSHPATQGLGWSFRITEEFYTFRENPRPNVHVLLTLDAASVGSSGDYPLAWCSTYGSGRVYYNALGHFEGTWQDVGFQQQLLGAIRWAAGRTPLGACGGTTPPSTPTPQPTATPAPTATIGTCPVRPRVALDLTRPAPGTLEVVVSATDGPSIAGNLLRRIAFTRLANAEVTMGSFIDRRAAFAVDLSPAARTARFTVERLDAARAVHVDLTVTDGCGTWNTFVGVGTG